MKNLKQLFLFILVFSWTSIIANPSGLFQPSQNPDSKQSKATSSPLPPTMVYGVVTDCVTGLPIAGVNVMSFSPEQIQTNALGYYEFFVDPGTYDVDFEKMGYEGYVDIITVVDGVPYELNVGICPTPNPVPWVLAQPNQAGTSCMVTWGMPEGAYELLYDDGSWEDITNWSTSGGMVAVRFSPEGYPATITGGRLNVGDGSFPVGGNFLGTDLKLSILDDDGAGGLPGTVLDEVVLTVDNYGWVDFPDIFEVQIEAGDFYLAMTQLGAPDNSAPIAANTDSPLAMRSYKRAPSGTWVMNANEDYMIRAYVFGSNNVLTTKGMGNGGFSTSSSHEVAQRSRNINYLVALISNFDPCLGPETGTITVFGPPPMGGPFIDASWGFRPPGFYAYAVKAVYSLGASEWTYSNVVGLKMDAEVTVNVSLCYGGFAEGAEVSMIGMDCPFQYDMVLTNPSGAAVFDSIIFGNYELNISQVGYNPVMLNLNITDDTIIDVVLTQKLYPARNVVVDSVTSIVTWDEPVITALEVEGFEGPDFPPPGWQLATIGMGWFRSEDGGSPGFPVPPGDGQYAITNSDIYPGVDASLDYLITPNIDLRESPTFALHFDHFFTMINGEAAYVEYSLDAGATWDVLQTLSPVASWTSEEVDLSALSGLSGESNIWFAFHYTNNNNNAGGWAVDNVSISNGSAPNVLAYYIYLDQAFLAETTPQPRTFFLANLTFGQTYQVGISPVYACAVAEPTVYSWTSGFLYPPQNMEDQYVEGAEEVPLRWNPPNSMFKKGNSSSVHADKQLLHVGGNGERDLWDILYQFDIATASGLFGLAGAESDGDYIYATQWSGNNIVKFSMDGTFIETFNISGVADLRDLAFDGTYMYGSNASTTVYQMDFVTHQLIGTFTAPTNVRAIAYDEVADGFWANDWNSDLILFDRSGTVLNTIPNCPEIYGLAYDWYSMDGPFLWLFEGTTNGNGCWLSQWDIATKAPTGVQHSVSDDFGSQGIAGGLYLSENIVEGKITLGGTMQGGNSQAFGYELMPSAGPNDPPVGLVGFNLYQDDVQIAQIPYEGQGIYDWIYDTVRGLAPGDYVFGVTAEYELTHYGFPGEIKESLRDFSDTVHVAYGTVIPFLEDFSSGNFENNGWQVSRSNWQISTEQGSPAPAAQFSGEPLLENNYSSTLTSYPMRADQLTEGLLYLDVDIRLDDINATGLEMLDVDVFDGNSWHTMVSMANEGSFDFVTQHLDITEYGMGEILKIRFNAHGQHSTDMNSWFVDNISVYRVCESISDLAAVEYDIDHALISWISPVVTTKTSDRQVTGFNVYRKTDGMSDYELFDYVPSQPGQEAYTYLDETTTIGVGYCYQVTCLWESETDYCESAPGFNVALTEDYVCLSITDVNNPDDNTISLYPNPATEKLTVTSNTPMKRLQVMNYAGQVVFASQSAGEIKVVLNTDSYDTGVYMVQITTDSGVTTKRFVVAE